MLGGKGTRFSDLNSSPKQLMILNKHTILMNIIITGHHIKITPAIENYITSKFHKIESHFSQLINVKFTLSVEVCTCTNSWVVL